VLNCTDGPWTVIFNSCVLQPDVSCAKEALCCVLQERLTRQEEEKAALQEQVRGGGGKPHDST